MRASGARRQSVGLRREFSVLRWDGSRTVLYGAILRFVSYKPGWAEQEVVRLILDDIVRIRGVVVGLT